MARYLISTTEVYRVDNESEVKEFIEESKQAKEFDLAKYTSEFKEVKSKGEVIDSYYKVSFVKKFNVEKEPDTCVTVNYEVD